MSSIEEWQVVEDKNETETDQQTASPEFKLNLQDDYPCLSPSRSLPLIFTNNPLVNEETKTDRQQLTLSGLKQKLYDALNNFEFFADPKHSKTFKDIVIQKLLEMTVEDLEDVISSKDTLHPSGRLEILKVLLVLLKSSPLNQAAKVFVIITLLDVISTIIPDEFDRTEFGQWLRLHCIPLLDFMHEIAPNLFRNSFWPHRQ